MDIISLSSGVRSGLNTLKETDHKLRRTLERLSTGKEVNSPLDDPTNFFIATSLRAAASDLQELQDGIKQGISVIKATEQGLSGVTALLVTMKGLVDDAATSSDPARKLSIAKVFDETYAQLNTLVKDSSYGGTNLISNQSADPLDVASQDLEIPLNSNGAASFQVPGSFMGSGYFLRETPGGLPVWIPDERGNFISGQGPASGGSVGNLSDISLIIRFEPQYDTNGDLNANGILEAGEGTEIDFKLSNSGASPATGISFSNATISTGWGFDFNTGAHLGDVAPGDSVMTDSGTDLDLNLPAGSDGTQFSISLDVTSDGVTKPMTFGPLTVGSITNGQALSISGGGGVPGNGSVSTNSLKVDNPDYQNGAFDVTFPGPPPVQKMLYAEKQGLKLYHSWVYQHFQTPEGIDAARGDLDVALSMVRSYQADLSSGGFVITTREEFNATLSNTFQTGADDLTLADMDREAASALMLQTREELATTGVTISTQAARSVVKMLA
jgi:flagellin